MENGRSDPAHEVRYRGKTSRRWPDGRPLCGADKGDKLPDGSHGPHKGFCQRTAGERTPHAGHGTCWQHGGTAPSHIAAGQVAMARAAMATYGQKADTNPVDALLDEVRWTAGHVAWLRERVREIEQEALTWGKTEQVDKQASEFPGVDTTEAARPNVWLVLYQQERKHLVDVCKAAISAGIEERRVRLAEQQGEVIVGVIQAILGDLGLSPEQQAMVPEVVPRRLRAVT
jgi:hypothetical protein